MRLSFTLVALLFLSLTACQAQPSSRPSNEAQGPPNEPGPALQVDVYPEVWSSNGYDGQTYEFKVNCGSNYAQLEECFLWDVTRVAVISPDNVEYDLEKDFNVNAYSGEVTRRWVLYGPSGEGLPASGEYQFTYYQDGDVVLQQTVAYEPETVGRPTDVTWRREGNDLLVDWTPPEGARSGMWYKVLIFPDGGEVISQTFEWDADNARMPEIPLADGDQGTLNVAIYFGGGYAYSEYLPLEW